MNEVIVMKKLLKYVGTGLLVAYAVHGGCDNNIEDVLNEKYSKPLIATRKVAARFLYEKVKDSYNAIEEEQKNLEKRTGDKYD